MNLILTRDDPFIEAGVFGVLRKADTKEQIAVTLEHAYASPFGFSPKVPPGQYVCQRGMHRLERWKWSIETFEITDVPGHTDILFHVGNYNQDSSGCVLLGMARGDQMILNSRLAFAAFMLLQKGVESFTLIVE